MAIEIPKIPQVDRLLDPTGRIARSWFRFLQALWNRGMPTNVTFAAGNFTANGSMTWTVALADQLTYQYSLAGREMTVKFWIQNSTIGGTLNNSLFIAIPAGMIAARWTLNPVLLIDSGTRTTGYALVGPDDTAITIARTDAGNFTSATDTTHVMGQLTFEVKQ